MHIGRYLESLENLVSVFWASVHPIPSHLLDHCYGGWHQNWAYRARHRYPYRNRCPETLWAHMKLDLSGQEEVSSNLYRGRCQARQARQAQPEPAEVACYRRCWGVEAFLRSSWPLGNHTRCMALQEVALAMAWLRFVMVAPLDCWGPWVVGRIVGDPDSNLLDREAASHVGPRVDLILLNWMCVVEVVGH